MTLIVNPKRRTEVHWTHWSYFVIGYWDKTVFYLPNNHNANRLGQRLNNIHY